jgi:hypothetical protein
MTCGYENLAFQAALCVMGENSSGATVVDTATIHVPRVFNASLYTGAGFDEGGTLILFSAEIPFKVMDASSLEISDGSRVPTSTAPFFTWNKETGKNFVDFSYSGTNKLATIKLTDDRPSTLSVQVFGLDGKMHVSSSKYLSGAHAHCEVNLNHLSGGIYIIRVSRENEMNAFKVVK